MVLITFMMSCVGQWDRFVVSPSNIKKNIECSLTFKMSTNDMY
jgi:hypothetical protein